MTAFNADGSSLWSNPSSTAGGNVIVGDDGTIYSGGEDGIFAFSSAGDVKWMLPVIGRPSISLGFGGAVYLQYYTEIHSLDATGGTIWSHAFAPIEQPWPIVGGDGTIYARDEALSPDGEIKFVFPDHAQARAIGPDGTLYATGDSGVYAFEP